jgi:hypothetical protein
MQRSRCSLGFVGLIVLTAGIVAAAPQVSSGASPDVARHWTADNGNGTYSNPLF